MAPLDGLATIPSSGTIPTRRCYSRYLAEGDLTPRCQTRHDQVHPNRRSKRALVRCSACCAAYCTSPCASRCDSCRSPRVALVSASSPLNLDFLVRCAARSGSHISGLRQKAYTSMLSTLLAAQVRQCPTVSDSVRQCGNVPPQCRWSESHSDSHSDTPTVIPTDSFRQSFRQWSESGLRQWSEMRLG